MGYIVLYLGTEAIENNSKLKMAAAVIFGIKRLTFSHEVLDVFHTYFWVKY